VEMLVKKYIHMQAGSKLISASYWVRCQYVYIDSQETGRVTSPPIFSPLCGGRGCQCH